MSSTFNASDISIWGPKLWASIHTLSFAYPLIATTVHKKAAVNFLESTMVLLPCDKCREHMGMYLRKSNFESHLNNRRDFTTWVVDFHNDVNIRLQKQTKTYDEVAELYRGEFTCPPVIHNNEQRLPCIFSEFCVSAMCVQKNDRDGFFYRYAPFLIFMVVISTILLLRHRNTMH